MIHVSARHRVVGVPVRPDLDVLFPNAPKVTWAGNNLIIVPHSFMETKLLRERGFDVPAPVLTQYQWPHPAGEPPFEVQKRTVAMLTTNQRAYNLNGMGTGKTRCALWAYDFLRSIGQAKRALIIAPLSTLSFTWQREAFRCFPHLSSTVLVGKRDKRLKLLGDDHHLFVINPDGLKVIGSELLARHDIDTLIIDELAVFRNAKGEKNKYLRELTKRMVWAWGMTGSPTPNEPTDAYGQCLILTPHTVPQRFTHFREAVMLRESQFRWIPKKEAKDHVFSVMQPAVRFTLDDVAELPPFIERQVDIDLGTKQKEVYDALKNHAYVLHQQQEITAANAGAVLNKLLQISLGYVYSKGKDDTERRVTSLDNTNRLDRLVDDINACDQKVIVFAPFDHAIDGIVARLREEKIEAAVVKGGVQSKVRNQIFAAFQQTQKYRVIVAHPGTMAHGVTLTAASCIIWFGPTTSLETFEQANARIRRVGQKHKQLFLMYQSTPAERRMYARLRAKQRVQDGVLELFANAQL